MMNIQSIRYRLGLICVLEALVLFLPFFLAVFFREGWSSYRAYLIPISILLLVAVLATRKKPKSEAFYAKEGFVFCALTWFVLAFGGAWPFVIQGSIPKFYDAFFEMASGFTTTGASILRDVEALPQSLLFWRSFSHLIGGMGVLVFAIAILSQGDNSSIHAIKAEVPGPSFGKLVSKMRDTARWLYLIYLAMMLGLLLILCLCGMSLFDACIYAFGTAGTGGFANYSDSLAHFHSPLIEWVIAFGMLLFGVNFNLYFLIVMRQGKKALRSEELRWYIGIVIAATVAICFLLAPRYTQLEPLLRDSFFTVATVISTTGFGTVDFAVWPLAARVILLFLMFTGACAGSTAGGFKIARVALLTKSAGSEVQRQIKPRHLRPTYFEGHHVTEKMISSVAHYFMLYTICFAVLVFLVSIDSPDIETAIGAVSATFNNIGPGLSAVGPTQNYADFTPFSKLCLSFGMIAGRLEILPVLIFFSPHTWKRV